jgi:hypothetical protein
MKIRQGYVSNSSSSSFIVRDDNDKKQAESIGCKLYAVNDIITYYQKIFDSLPFDNDPDDKILPYFMKQCGQSADLYSFRDQIKNEIEYLTKFKDFWITSAVDRDYASQKNVDLELFEGDL